MKKSLFAVAAAGAFAGVAGTAAAQSSVTVYGLLDVGYIAQTTSGTGVIGGATNGAYGTGTTTDRATVKNNASGFNSSAESTSRLGFRGTEDIGGGTSAVFTFEFGLTPTNSQSAVGQTNAITVNNRQSFVGLKKNGVGTATIGTQYTAIHDQVAVTDPGQANNMPGNLIYPADNSVNNVNTGYTAGNSSSACNFQANAATTGQAAVNSAACTTVGGPGVGTKAYTIRAGNMLKFVSDSFSGVKASAFYVQNSNTSSAGATTANTANVGGYNNNTGWGAGLDWTFKSAYLTGAYQSLKNSNYATTTTVQGVVTGGTATASSTTFSPSSTGTTAVNMLDSQAYIAGTYDFGILKAYAQYITLKSSASYDSNLFMKRTAQQIGVRSFVTPTVEAWASGSTGKITNNYYVQAAAAAASTQSVNANLVGWQIGGNYWLSKRTNLYGIYGISKTANAVYPTTVAGNTININAVSSGISAYALGIRHTF